MFKGQMKISSSQEKEPQQGETWWVRIGDKKPLYSKYIEKITDKIVILKPYKISSNSSCFELECIKFVEEDL